MLYFIVGLMAVAAFASWLVARGWGRLLALAPLAVFGYAVFLLGPVLAGAAVTQSLAWVPSIGLSLSFYIDGLALLFVLLISGVGSLIFVYAAAYLHGHQDQGRFFFWLLNFTAAMLGLVTADNLLLLFVFWELTGITSYMLIGFKHESVQSRKLALQALLVTTAGGLALLTGFILLGNHVGSFSLSTITRVPLADTGPVATAALVLIAVGAFTKSAQFPFHFWLPNAMAAPTPVSAFLHSATMVKAGIFLLARLHPSVGEHPVWSQLLLTAGAITMVLGAVLAYTAVDLKKVLANSTLMALGTLTVLLGIGTPMAVKAAVVFLLAHALYKASLFMLAGVIDHSAGTRDLERLTGLRHAMPKTWVLMIVAALSLAGVPPLLGFIAKELLLEAGLTTTWPLWVAVVVSAMLTSSVAFVLAFKPFMGPREPLPHDPHELQWPWLIGPMVLLIISVLIGLLPSLAGGLVTSAVTAIVGTSQPVKLALWHGLTPALGLSVLALIAGAVLALLWQASRRLAVRQRELAERFGFDAGYFAGLNAVLSLAAFATRRLQNGRLGAYLSTIVFATAVPVLVTLLTQYGWPKLPTGAPLNIYELAMVGLLIASTLYATMTQQLFASIMSLGALGYAIALIFVHFSAPDLGITQVLVETLTVLLLVLVLVKAPGFKRYSSRLERVRDAAVAILMGTAVTLLVLAALDVQLAPSISDYFIANSYELGKGRNIVNVILVDFRALDTLGEIFVLAIAALGVYSMVRLKGKNQ